MNPYYVLGLDPGIASCGFALIDTNNHKILEMGAHLFDAPQESKTKTSLAVARRNARSSRRNNERTKNRQKHCIRILVAAGLAPEGADGKWFQTVAGDKPSLELRAKGLDERLSDREFAQVLFTLSTRRGYIPHGEGAVGDIDSNADNETGKVLKAVADNARIMRDNGYRTVGEMLYRMGSSRNKAGEYDHSVRCSQIVDEVHALFEAQRSCGNSKATEDLESRYVDNLTWEKKTADHDAQVYSRVGACSYFPNEKRAARADLSSELCNAYERFAHLVMVDEAGAEARLTAQQRDGYVSLLFSPVPANGNKDCKVTYSKIRKDLDLPSTTCFKGVEAEKEKDTEPSTPKAWRCMRSHGVPSELLERMLNDRALADAIGEALTFASTEESLRQQLAPLELSEEEAESLCRLPFSGKLFKGYGSRSLKALGMLTDAFADPSVTTLIEAEKVTGLLGCRLSREGVRSELLPPYEVFDPTCTNPVVLRAMGRMRRIVNAIIRIYGVPNEVHVELGRDLKRSKREKAAVQKKQSQNERDNRRRRELAAGILGIEPDAVPYRIVEKLAFREEQDDKDAYTGQSIDLQRLVEDEHYCEIDHVLPYSRTCDNSRKNRVLALAESNQRKKERTPYEWMTSGEPDAPKWEEFSARVMANAAYDQQKKRRYLLNTNLDEEAQSDFLNRNLNDSRYMSVAVKNYIADSLLFPESDGKKNHVIAVAGGATASLRRAWGLNFGKGNEKDREDDRHHAVDACVIAACSQGTVQKVAKASARGRDSFERTKESRLAGTQPWPTFATEVTEGKCAVVPTRMVSHGVTGRAFEDTNYRLLGVTNDSKKLGVLRGNRKDVKKGNYIIGADGNAHLVDGMAFLRLWLDPDAKRGKGKWYAEPVYYADIPAMRNGSYVPRAAKVHVARAAWDPLPESAMMRQPIVLFRGDVLSVDGMLARYWSFNINSCSLELRPLTVDDDISGFPTLGKWSAGTAVKVVEEDCLGHCYCGLIGLEDEC